MGELSKVINIGEKLEEQLEEVGINSLEELKKTGSREAWLRIKAMDPSA
jgi:DNA transformation protein